VWAVVWLLMGAMWLLPANSSPNAVGRALVAAPSGVHWLASLQRSVGAAAAGHGWWIAIGLAAVSATVAIGVLLGRLERPLLAIAGLVALGYWVLGEGFGGVLTGQATDPNTGPLLVLLCASLWPVARHATTGMAGNQERGRPREKRVRNGHMNKRALAREGRGVR
jgi:hypothetical protein